MKIKFRQTGGFAGLAKSVEIDSRTISGEESEHLEQLLVKSCFFDQPEPAKKAVTDDEQYSISVETEGRFRTFHGNRSTLPDAMKPLIKYLLRVSKYEKMK